MLSVAQACIKLEKSSPDGPQTNTALLSLAERCRVLYEAMDFRSVYANLLSGWLKAPNVEKILGGKYEGLNVV